MSRRGTINCKGITTSLKAEVITSCKSPFVIIRSHICQVHWSCHSKCLHTPSTHRAYICLKENLAGTSYIDLASIGFNESVSPRATGVVKLQRCLRLGHQGGLPKDSSSLFSIAAYRSSMKSSTLLPYYNVSAKPVRLFMQNPYCSTGLKATLSVNDRPPRVTKEAKKKKNKATMSG